MMTTGTLLIGYYHGLLLSIIDANILTNDMCSVGLLTSHEQIVISSDHSIYQRNWLLLEHVRHMNVQALMAFCDLVQEIWPLNGSQLTTGVHTNCVYIASYVADGWYIKKLIVRIIVVSKYHTWESLEGVKIGECLFPNGNKLANLVYKTVWMAIV